MRLFAATIMLDITVLVFFPKNTQAPSLFYLGIAFAVVVLARLAARVLRR